MFSLFGGLPSGLLLPCLVPRSFESIIGTTPLSDSSPPFTSVVRPYAFTDRPDLSGNGEVSRFSCMLFLRVRGVYDYGGLGVH